VLVALSCSAATAVAQTSSSITVNGQAADTTNSPALQAPAAAQDAAAVADKDIYCPTALEPILPGDYYACEARAAFGRQHYRKMLDMLQEAAYWANKDAQFVLGLTYFNGGTPDVPQDRPLGLAWLALAAERRKPEYQLNYAAARAKATPAELQLAMTQWRKLRVKYGDGVAAARAIRRFNHEIEPIDDAAREGGIAYLSGFSPFPQSAFTIASKLHDQADADFNDVHGTVVVGRPDWVQAKPADATQANDTK
jgi:hypothetical protein